MFGRLETRIARTFDDLSFTKCIFCPAPAALGGDHPDQRPGARKKLESLFVLSLSTVAIQPTGQAELGSPCLVFKQEDKIN